MILSGPDMLRAFTAASRPSAGTLEAAAAEPAFRGLVAATLASLLVDAPQCVPFDARVVAFRAYVDSDKVRGCSTIPVYAG